ncbi:MAG: SDR family oxidoreductase [Chloroflexi bacterium]|nr:SDR family oxidoreductase [Chloroflexota bacterium]MDA1228203.1 SDR family oxidoreductase [Chloroflexota bacterium]
MDLELNGRTALITGGSRGIGKAIARELSGEGVAVAISGRTQQTLEATAKEIEAATGGIVVPIVADTTDGDSVRSMVQQAVDALGKLEILVNNAAPVGGFVQGGLEGAKEEDLLADINTKIMGYFRSAQAALPHLKKAGWGRIINISGMAARNAGTISGMRNLALVHFTKTLSMELGPFGINVNLIHPGTTYTERSRPLYEEQAKQRGITVEEVEAEVAGRNAIRKIVDASEIAPLAAFLCSPKSLAITGESISASGGAGSGVYA